MLHGNNTPFNETDFSDRFVCGAGISMLTCLLILALLVGASTARGQVSPQSASDPNLASHDRLQAKRQEAPDSTTGTQASYASDLAASHESPSWLFPMTKLNKSLPSWIRFGGQSRDRLRGPPGVWFSGTKAFFLLGPFCRQ